MLGRSFPGNRENSKMENALMPGELESIIFCASPSDIRHLGSPSWIEWHQRFQKLHQQAVSEAVFGAEELTKNAIVSNGKVPLLIHEAICISLWRLKIFPKILKLESNLESSFLLYAVLYHETVAVGLLEIVCHDEEACQSASDFLVDLIDYCIEMITGLLSLVDEGYLQNKITEKKAENLIEELERQKNDLLFDIGLRCLTIISCLSDILEKIHVSASSRLYSTHDTPLLIVELLQINPWQKRDAQGNVQQFIDGKWKIVHGEALEKLCRHETLAWLALWRLILNPELEKYYEFNNSRKTQLCKLQYKINESTMDQLPFLADLKRTLGRLGVSDIALTSTSHKRPVLIEVVPQIKPMIAKKISKNENKILDTQRSYYKLDSQELVEMAKKLSTSYASEILEHFDDGGPKCANCGEGAPKKCSRCKSEWYCGRECQVKRWGKHKELCDQFALVNLQ